MSKGIKRWITLALSMLLVFSAAAGMAETESMTDTERITDIQKALAEGGDKAMWELVNTHFATDRYLPEGCAELAVWSPQSPVFAVRNSMDYHMMNFYTVIVQETAGVGFTMEQMFLYTYDPDGGWKGVPYTLPNGSYHLDPLGGMSISVSCQASGNSGYDIVAVAGTDDNGHELEFYGVIQLLNGVEPANIPENPDYDTDNLRHEAGFMLQVDDAVWWVPANKLGKSRYTNREIADMSDHSPEQKQEEISTLYEAVQLFQISGFTSSEDNVSVVEENGFSWEHHKPGYDAVRTNTGCCAACADWLNYILSGDYEQVGFIGWTLPDGNGHVFNYIFQDGWYYFIDLTHYEGGLMTTETGDMGTYRYLEYPAGSVHMARTPEDFVKYYLKTTKEPPAVFDFYQAENVLPIASEEDENGHITVYYPEGYDFRIIDGINPAAVDIQIVAGPEKTYRWAGLKSADIKAKKKYLRTAEETDTEPLSAYQPGDRLTLEDRSEKGTAIIDGIQYGTSKRDEVRVSFESKLFLYGEKNNGVFSLRLPLGRHGESMTEMDSLALGDLIISAVPKIPEVQIIVCVREEDHLTVQEVIDGKYYDLRHISIHKDEDGNWTGSPDYWYLIITRDRKTRYEFGRFSCSISDEY